MPLLIKFIFVAVIAYVAGSTITPVLWGPVMVEEAERTLSPYLITSAALFIAAVGYVIGQFRRRE